MTRPRLSLPGHPEIDLLLSIGSACQTRYQIDNFMSKVHQNYKAESYYFDWLMLGGVTGVTNVISRGFDILPSMIELHGQNGVWAPRDRLSNHIFLHDFGQRWWEPDQIQADSRLTRTMGETIEKYRYLGKKTDDLLKSDVSIALVFEGGANDCAWKKLLTELSNRYRKEVPVLNILGLGQQATEASGIFTVNIDHNYCVTHGRPKRWQGCDESWFTGLSSLLGHQVTLLYPKNPERSL